MTAQRTLTMDYIHMKLTKTYKDFTKEELRALHQKMYVGCESSFKDVVEMNIPLVYHILRSDYGSHIRTLGDDLVSEGVVGLMKACERFDPDHGFNLSTYAQFWIRQKMSRYIKNQDHVVRRPVHITDKLFLIEKVRRNMEQELGHDVSNEYMSKELGIAVDYLDKIASYTMRQVSLDAKKGDDRDSMLEFMLPDTSNVEAQRVAEINDDVEHLKRVLDTLPTRSQDIMRRRFGIDHTHPHTLEEIGEVYDLTRERIRQIEAQSLKLMRQRLGKKFI